MTGETAFSRAHGSEIFPFLERDPGAAQIFNRNMTAMTRRQIDTIADTWPLARQGHLVDIGGGQGMLATSLLARYPDLVATVFDQPSVVAGASPHARCTFAGGDFFTGVPGGGDIYTLKDILHDWDDARAAQILANIHAAMRPGARLAVIERIVEPGNARSVAKDVDITMLVMTGGRERNVGEYTRLLASAGLEVEQIVSGESASIIVAMSVPRMS